MSNNQKNQGKSSLLDRFRLPFGRSGAEKQADTHPMDPVLSAPAVSEEDAATARSSEDLGRASDQFAEIASVLRGMDTSKATPGNAVELPIAMVLSLIPLQHRTSVSPPAGGPTVVSVEVDNLFDQLAGGRVVVPVALLVMDVPAECVASTAYQDYTTVVSLPLEAVVSSIPPERLTALLSPETHNPIEDRLPDPFSSPHGEELPTAETPAASVAPAASAASVASVAPAACDPLPVPSPMPAAPAIGTVTAAASPVTIASRTDADAADQPDLSSEQGDRLHGVDINTATEALLRTLPGVTALVARQIVLHREANGPFRSVFALLEVAHVGRVTFRKMTGMPYNARHVHRVHRLARLLAIPAENARRLPIVAERLAARPGFAGCVISDAEGMVLAESRAGDSAATLGALAPRLLTRVEESFREMDSGDVATLSLSVADRMFTIVRRANIFVCAMHRRRRVTLGDLRLTERVAEELAWMLSYRACVTPATPPAPDVPEAMDGLLPPSALHLPPGP